MFIFLFFLYFVVYFSHSFSLTLFPFFSTSFLVFQQLQRQPTCVCSVRSRCCSAPFPSAALTQLWLAVSTASSAPLPSLSLCPFASLSLSVACSLCSLALAFFSFSTRFFMCIGKSSLDVSRCPRTACLLAYPCVCLSVRLCCCLAVRLDAVIIGSFIDTLLFNQFSNFLPALWAVWRGACSTRNWARCRQQGEQCAGGVYRVCACTRICKSNWQLQLQLRLWLLLRLLLRLRLL